MRTGRAKKIVAIASKIIEILVVRWMIKNEIVIPGTGTTVIAPLQIGVDGRVNSAGMVVCGRCTDKKYTPICVTRGK